MSLRGLGLALAATPGLGFAAGVTPYLPLNLDPEIEWQVERVLLFADRPVLRRPIPLALVYEALPAACEVDTEACHAVEAYLRRYEGLATIGHASVQVAATDGAELSLPNEHGLPSSSAWQASAAVLFRPTQYLIASVGGVAYDGEATPTGSLVSLGVDWMQLDVGWRDRWLSPLADGAMLVSSHAPTMPSVTLSNWRPLTRFGFTYEIFAAEESWSDRIVWEDGYTEGHPTIAGLHFAIQPGAGWSLGFNRVLQFGGGERGGHSFGDVLEALFNPSGMDNSNSDDDVDDEFGNQLASFTGTFNFPGPVPFAVFMEYAGEDTSRGRNYLLGNAALSLGLRFPRIARHLDLSYEVTERQNGWYAHHIYQDGFTNEGRVIGHWAADQSSPADDVGGWSQSLRLDWLASFGGLVQLQLRSLANQDYSGVDYEDGYDASLRYARAVGNFTLGGEVRGGRDVFGEDYTRIGLFARYGSEALGLARSGNAAPRAERLPGSEVFVDVGASMSDVEIDLEADTPTTTSERTTNVHFGIGARRRLSAHQDLGVRLEFDEVDGSGLIGLRALDYRYRFAGPIALSGFVGAARYDLATPAYGFYAGAGASWRDVFPGWDLSLEGAYVFKAARDKLTADDPPIDPRPDEFYDIRRVTLQVSRKF